MTEIEKNRAVQKYMERDRGRETQREKRWEGRERERTNKTIRTVGFAFEV